LRDSARYIYDLTAMNALGLVNIMHLEVILLLVFSITSLAEAVKYELSVLDEDIFSSCHDPDPSTLDINGLMDFSDLTTSMDADGITVKGNTTLVWDIQQKDRVQVIKSLNATNHECLYNS